VLGWGPHLTGELCKCVCVCVRVSSLRCIHRSLSLLLGVCDVAATVRVNHLTLVILALRGVCATNSLIYLGGGGDAQMPEMCLK